MTELEMIRVAYGCVGASLENVRILMAAYSHDAALCRDLQAERELLQTTFDAMDEYLGSKGE